MHHSSGMIGEAKSIDKQEKERYSMNMLETKKESSHMLNHACCVCQSSLNGQPFNPDLQTSHGYCEACLEDALANIGGTNEIH